MTTVLCVKRKASESFKDSLYVNGSKKLKVDESNLELPKKRKLIIYKHIESIPAGCTKEEIESTLLSHFQQNGEEINAEENGPSKRLKIVNIKIPQHPSNVTCNGVPMKAVTTPILSPAERIMDKAIYDAFNCNQYDDIFKAVSMGIDINFQRPLADGVTAFMAACAAGNLEMMERLRNLGAKANIKNFDNENAIDIVNKIYKPTHPDSPEYYHIIEVLELLINEDDQKDDLMMNNNQSDVVYDYYIKTTDEIAEEDLNNDELYNELLDFSYNEDKVNENDDERDSEDENNSENDYPDEESDDNSSNRGMEYDDDDDDDIYVDNGMNDSDNAYCGSDKEMNDLEEY